MENQEIVIATMHQKELVIAPVFEFALNRKCILPTNFDSDQFGTFSGERDRKKSPLETSVDKAKLAMEMTGCEFSIASEGSFGPHPFIPFSPANEEFMVFIDKRNDVQITERLFTTQTNFARKTVRSFKELKEFLPQIGFPSHGVILKVISPEVKYVKGIQDEQELEYHFNIFKNESTDIIAETDMRAMYNPTRMTVIGELAQKLVARILTKCPSCEASGFGPSRSETGLPCAWCGGPTESILKNVSSCLKCSHEVEEWYPNEKEKEDPMYCQTCNP